MTLKYKEDDYVICLLCNKKFAHITWQHLECEHGITMERYRERFPDAILTAKYIKAIHIKALSKKGKTWEELYGEEHASKMKQNQSERVSGTGNPNYGKPSPEGAGQSIWCMTLKGHWVRSTWEKTVCDWLWLHGIEYWYEVDTFELEDEDGIFTYTPDLYIPELGCYWEIKGFMNDKSIRQIRAFTKLYPNFILIRGDDMEQFGMVF